MDYYINPLWFWLINICDNVECIGTIIFAFSIVVLAFAFFDLKIFDSTDNEKTLEYEGLMRKSFIVALKTKIV